jgi:hypothetical protein
MAKIIKVKNNKGTDDTWVGQGITAGAEVTVDPTLWVTWSSDSKVLTDAATGDLGVSDGTTYFTTGSARIDWLKGNPAPALSAAGNPIVEYFASTGAPGAKAISLVTPNLGDRTTWYQKSVQVTTETLTDSGNGLLFNSAHPWWVDIYNEKLTYTYKQVPKRDGSFGKHADWAVTIYVNGTTLPQVVSGVTQWTVNFVAGTVTFTSSQTSNTITATYWHTDGVSIPSEWLFNPASGKIYTINCVELQYSMNIPAVFNTILFEIWAGANVSTYGSFSNALFDAGYGQFRASYRNVWDIVNVTNNQSSAVIPKHGGMTQDLFIAPFNYTQAIRMAASQGTLLRMCLDGDEEIPDVEIASACFYLTIQ